MACSVWALCALAGTGRHACCALRACVQLTDPDAPSPPAALLTPSLPCAASAWVQVKRATRFLYDLFVYAPEDVIIVFTHSGFTRSVLLAMGRVPEADELVGATWRVAERLLGGRHHVTQVCLGSGPCPLLTACITSAPAGDAAPCTHTIVPPARPRLCRMRQ